MGAWWVGFFAASFITWLAAIPVLAFPRELPAAKELDADTSEMHGGRGAEEMEKIQNKLAEGNVKVGETRLLCCCCCCLHPPLTRRYQ